MQETHVVKNKKVKIQHKIWKPANRDTRTYKQVVEEVLKEKEKEEEIQAVKTIKVEMNKEIESWLERSLIGEMYSIIYEETVIERMLKFGPQ